MVDLRKRFKVGDKVAWQYSFPGKPKKEYYARITGIPRRAKGQLAKTKIYAVKTGRKMEKAIEGVNVNTIAHHWDFMFSSKRSKRAGRVYKSRR